MLNIHPPLTAFPFALLTVVVVLEFISLFSPKLQWTRVIGCNLVIALLGVVAAFFSGYQANDLANASFVVSDQVIERHHFWGRTLLFTIFPCLALHIAYRKALFGRKIFRALYLLALLMCWVMVLYTGFLGGELVFKHGAGVLVSTAK